MKLHLRRDALIFTISFFIFFLLLLLLLPESIIISFSQSSLITLAILLLPVGYILFVLITNAFIFKNIRKITAILRTSGVSQQTSSKMHKNNDPITELEKEVNNWTEDRKAEIEKLNKLETYRKEYLGNVSHELKTPIFNIQGYILTLLDGGLEDPSINRDYLARAEKSVERMIGIVEDLQAISQLEAGELQLEYENFDVSALAKDVFHSNEMKATTKGISFALADEKPVIVYADKFRIRQVLTNLIVNSIKYGKEYGATTIRFSDIGETILVEVSDNGIGIGKEHLPRLFERFYRVDKSRSRDQGGTGLGLAIVKHIIEAHGQSIQVMSTEGAGSVFSFTLKKAVA